MKVLIGTPIAGGHCTATYTMSLLRLMSHVLTQRTDVELVMPGFFSGALVARARNAYASLVLEDTSLTHLLFIDSDIGFRPEAVLRMLDFDRDVVGALYPSRSQPDQGPMVFVGGQALVRAPQGYAVHQGFVQTQRIGTGLTLIKRGVLERLRQAFPELRAPPEESYRQRGLKAEVFQCFEAMADETGLYMGEDVSFCRRWQSLGGEFWALVEETVAHVGFTRIEGRFADRWLGAATTRTAKGA